MLVRMWRTRNAPPLLVRLQAGITTVEISLVDTHKIVHSITLGPSYTTPGHMLQHVIRIHVPLCS